MCACARGRDGKIERESINKLRTCVRKMRNDMSGHRLRTLGTSKVKVYRYLKFVLKDSYTVFLIADDLLLLFFFFQLRMGMDLDKKTGCHIFSSS